MPRPPKPPGEKYTTPNRFVGRISAAEWAEITEAAQASGETLTAWAKAALLKAARKQKRRVPV